MSGLGRKVAAALDATAAKAYETGTRIAGEKGGEAADIAMSAVFGGIRSRIDVDCTRPDCTHEH